MGIKHAYIATAVGKYVNPILKELQLNIGNWVTSRTLLDTVITVRSTGCDEPMSIWILIFQCKLNGYMFMNQG